MVKLFVFTSGFVWGFLAIAECFSGYCVTLLNAVFCINEYLASTQFFWGGGGGAGKTLSVELF